MATKDVLSSLESDHRSVERLFKRLSEAGPRAIKTKRRLAERLISELSVHAAVEEQVLYPLARELSEETDREVLESLEEHHAMKVLLSELDGMDPADERFDAKVKVITDLVTSRISHEESELFPMLAERLDTDTLTEMADAVASARKTAPTRPHPRSPDTPPGNLANLVAGLADRVRDRVRAA